MSGKIILNLAISLDGYIADNDGGYNWISGDGDKTLNTSSQFDFAQFTAGIDVVLMGSQCYEQGMAEPYSDKTVYVASSKERQNTKNITFIKGDIAKVIAAEKAKGKNIYLFGGGKVIDPFIKQDIIDEYYVGIIPIILGSGRPLFLGNNPTLPLHLEACYIDEGVTILKYSKRS